MRFVLIFQDPQYPSNRQKLLRFKSKMEQEHGSQWRKIMENEDLEEGAAEKARCLVDFDWLDFIVDTH